LQFTETSLPGVFIIEPKVFADARGYFMESYKQLEFEKHIGKISWIQENESKSSKGVLRGLHLQTGEFAQAKLVRVVTGRVLDVAVDVREGSATYGKHVAVELSAENHRQLFIPRGFAHGFLVLSDECIFQYKVDNVYCKESEGGFHYQSFGIEWPEIGMELNLSEKDLILPKIACVQCY
jgi:dTDP-4-dehydrorhamnose 3,5-epimerase